jgi:F0F1-type ATP synthase membrane subunit c/vacuolar-type H+-ATPase subunit K
MRFVNMLFIAVLAVLCLTSPVFAGESAGTGAGIGMGLAIVGIGIGIGLVGYAALGGIARQPEQAGAIQGAMYVLAGLVEGAGIIALVLCLALLKL